MMNILILCTGNSARSILGEALFNARGAGAVTAYSAGSKPKDAPHAGAIAVLQRNGITTEGLRSKSWVEFEAEDAPVMDAVITVCDNAASEPCPVWPGAPARAHWGLPDPADATGAEQIRGAFDDTFKALDARITAALKAGLASAGPAGRSAILQRVHDQAEPA
ncbi:MAG: arsenate reductase ArsC [Oceanicaulis sp.]